jgi:hypothetical protein
VVFPFEWLEAEIQLYVGLQVRNLISRLLRSQAKLVTWGLSINIVQYCEAMLAIVVKNNTTTQLVDAVIDMEFSGFLTLPSEIISALDLT